MLGVSKRGRMRFGGGEKVGGMVGGCGGLERMDLWFELDRRMSVKGWNRRTWSSFYEG